MKREFGTGIWTFDTDFSFFGMKLGGRMTIAATPSGLAVFSPIKPDGALFEAVDQLGKVTYIVAPNRLHHLYVGHWAARYPEAKVLLADGLERKRKDLHHHGILGKENGGLDQDFQVISYQGMPMMSESVFFHRQSQTLITTDLVMNVRNNDHFLTRASMKMQGAYGKVSQDMIHYSLTWNRKAAADSAGKICALPFDRVVACHGELIGRNHLQEFRDAFKWLG